MATRLEESIRSALHEFVLTKLPLGVYDPAQPRRPRVPVVAFDIELLEFDEEEKIAHGAGPVTLRAENGDIEFFLRVSAPVEIVDGAGRIDERRPPRAAYIVDLNTETGACKETAALANA